MNKLFLKSAKDHKVMKQNLWKESVPAVHFNGFTPTLASCKHFNLKSVDVNFYHISILHIDPTSKEIQNTPPFLTIHQRVWSSVDISCIALCQLKKR